MPPVPDDDGGMTTTGVQARTIGGTPRRMWSEGRRAERTAYAVGAVLFAAGVVHVGVLLVTGRTWTGPLSLRKAATFGLSFGLTLATVTAATSVLSMRERARSVLLGVFTVACVVETVLVTMQAWRGVPSHFNFETPFDTAVAMTLAAGGGAIIVTVYGFAWATMAGMEAMPPSMRLAVRSGFLVLLLAPAVGAVMIARGVAEARSGSAHLAYDTAGALKPVHAVAMHAILVLPGIAWLLRFTDRDERSRIRLVVAGVAGYVVLTVVVAIESFRGVSPFAASTPELSATAVGLALLVGAGVTAVAGALSRTAGRAIPEGDMADA
jgi:hypothetical protein